MASFLGSPCCSRRPGLVLPPAVAQHEARQRKVVALATLSGQGHHIPARSLKVKHLVGQGSFGEVFEGALSHDGGEPERIIMKRVKAKVEGAVQMSENEHLLNVHVTKNAADSCADFLGYTSVSSSGDVIDRKLTQGKWLLWRYQGLKTLGDYLRKRDCLNALAVDLQVAEHLAVPTVLQQVLESVSRLHAAGLVHRDVKPSNIIFCEQDRTFRLIDLGAMADLRTGINYCPDESILDPYYCPPEQYVLPTDAPDLAKKSRVMSLALSSMLWNKHKPDRFDMYSIGLIMLQLCMPHLRTKSALQSFHSSFKRCRYDLERWRTVSSLQPNHTKILDADDGAGWKLAAKLLRPRKVQVLTDGHVYFTNEGAQRPSAEQALKSAFVASANEVSSAPVAVPIEESEKSSGIFGMFRGLQRQLTRMEDTILKKAEEAEQATTTVQRLRQQVEAGEAKVEQLEKAEGVLVRLTGSLQYLQAEMDATLRGADAAFKRGLVGTQHVADNPNVPYPDGAEPLPPVEAFTSSSESEFEAPEPSSDELTEQQEQQAGWSLANMFLGGIKSMGKAVKITGKIVDQVNEEAQGVMGRYVTSSMSSDEAAFMTMLDEANISVTSRWEDVQRKLAKDARFQAILGEQKVDLFRSYVRMRQEVDGMRLDGVEREFMRQLSYRISEPDKVTWTGLRAAWKDEPFYEAIDERTGEILFVRHVTMLQMKEAELAKSAAAEIAFRSMLNSLHPPVSASSEWPDVRRAVSLDARMAAIPEARRETLFEELRGEAELRESLEQQQLVRAATTEADKGGAATPMPVLDTDDELSVLSVLRSEQAKLKEEYDRMEEKLSVMESRLRDRSDEASVKASISVSAPPRESNGAARESNGAAR